MAERIAIQVGFGSPTAFRDRFKSVVGTSPQAYRRVFQGPVIEAGAVRP
ncbi:AraC family transcriptional regulator [Planotetraspora sp. A-T 1434]|nr:AraC family transcriptional regulator [Planotetraspora sp. A-T 1434]MCT9932234.1 AraC family transcriptional regulator [Planotetraspora sp. A-T 1434]